MKSREQLLTDAKKWADKRIGGILESAKDEDRPLNGEEEALNLELLEWGIDLSKTTADQMTVIKALVAREQFQKLQLKYGPPTKWERVTGKKLSYRD